MPSINISIKREAYEFLKNMKSKNKSFSEVILNFKKDQNNAMQFFGVLKDFDWKEKEKNIKHLRSSFDRRLK
mgnify:CR=1 FL=1